MNAKAPQPDLLFFDRDLSWLSFNERVLSEAARDSVPLMERFRFLAIYSSNLDEFYRVRMPTLMALNKLRDDSQHASDDTLIAQINSRIEEQLNRFGTIINNQIIPALKSRDIHLVYNEQLPESIRTKIQAYFIHTVAGYLHILDLSEAKNFFPENNKIYLAVLVQPTKKGEQLFVVNIPSDVISRFFKTSIDNKEYIIFLDDVIKANLPLLFPDKKVLSYSFKVTRNAELDLEDEFTGNLAKKIERKIVHRDFGLATRFLYEPGLPENTILYLKDALNLKAANFIAGGTYHNLKDLFFLPLHQERFNYEAWPKVELQLNDTSLFAEIKNADVLLHPPYHTYDYVLRFFNEASIDPRVEIIYVTLYRVASDSRIVSALINASKNGKRVVVFVELKARFDEANNIKWSKRMKRAGVKIIESIPGLKVHAKLALIKRRTGARNEFYGLLSTGNFNETTARIYTDQILMTANESILKEVEQLFKILKKKKTIDQNFHFKKLLVGHFNLQQRFIELIDREIHYAKAGKAAWIKIKFNNLEEEVLISKLYEASCAGVTISLIVRGICCLVPGRKDVSENITVTRIVDRYLEHGRIFIFGNDDSPDVFLGSADWMNRNIYRRIEVCFPVEDELLRKQLMDIVNIQLQDNVQAVAIDERCDNVEKTTTDFNDQVRSQLAIATMLSRGTQHIN